MKDIPLDYPEKLWYYDNEEDRISPSWAEVYYCCRYDEFLYVFINKNIDTKSEVIDVEQVKKIFLSDYCVNSIDCSLSEWHSYFNEYISRSMTCFTDECSIAIPAKCLVIYEGMNKYQIALPESKELLYEIIDGNISFELKNEKEYISYLESRIDDFVIQYTEGIYSTLHDYYKHEKDTVSYFKLLKRINEIRINEYNQVFINKTRCYVINLGALIMPFPFSNIGFTSKQKEDVLYYNPLYNVFIYQSQLLQYDRFNEFIKLEYQLIEIPVFTSPYQILYENKLSTDLNYDKTKIEKMYSYYDLPTIYVDSFWNEYGYRSSTEIIQIYSSICKYKSMEYNWLREHGIRILLNDTDKFDIMEFLKHT